MGEGLEYLRRMREQDFHRKTKLLILKEVLLFKKEEGKFCKSCNLLQGCSYNGFEHYYCIHCRNRINKKMKKEEEKIKKIIGEILSLTLYENERLI